MSQPTTFTRRILKVAKAWLRKPSEVATICPSSSHLTENLARRECVHQALSVVELGPGGGETTTALLSQMRPDSRLMVIEKMAVFMDTLDEIDDPRLIAVHGDAADLIPLLQSHRFSTVDVVVSGIPFSTIAPATARRIMQSIDQALKPGGFFLAYQMRSDVERYAMPHFGSFEREAVPMNLPPLWVYQWRKSVEA